jgi:diacylglycerol kinase family enzyme
MLPRVFKGTHVRDPRFEVLRGREVMVSADRPFVVYADGDPIGELPATITCRPGAVRVLLPGAPR